MSRGATGTPRQAVEARALLDEAAGSVAAALEDELPDAARERAQAREALGEVTRSVARVLEGEDPARAAATLGRTGVHSALLRRLLVETLRPGHDEPSSAAAIRVAAAVERTLAALRGDPEDLLARMVEPDAFELLVEVAHDFRSPLSAILFLSETLRSGFSGDVNDLQRTQLGLIYSAAFALAGVASDVVDLARDGAGLVEPRWIPYSVSKVVHNVERMVAPIAEEKGLELRIELPEEDRARGDPSALGRILLNLATNALHATEEGFVEIGVRADPPSRLTAWVRDSGPGMTEEDRKELFQPFRKRERQEGYLFSRGGLGLSIVRRILRTMGSALEVESDPGRGSRFSFVLEVPGEE